MASLNKVVLIGNLTADPELKQTPNGISVCNFSIGVTRRYKNAEGRYDSDFFNIVTWRSTAEFVSKYFRKGKSICIVGSLQQRTWVDQQQQKRYVVEVVADEVSFVDKMDSGQSYGGQAAEPTRDTADTYNPPSYSSTGGQADTFEDLTGDDDLPF
ncbi:MAG: single-stranded DNA-binding protein [Eubacteriales bacterium]|jgi:single-strand DNA-binding protein|nr:single-stranded DNA-binding protein [Eubacteriales bacterium]